MYAPEAIVRNTFVRSVELHEEIDSTSDRALELCRGALPTLPALVLARRQTAGRGSKGRSWWSTGGALTFSLVIDPAEHGLPPDRLPLAALFMGQAVADAMVGAAASAWLKWPNDLYVGWRKLCGVLVEAPAARQGRKPLVVGVGVNVNNPSTDAPPELREHVTSLCELHHRAWLPDDFGRGLDDLLRRFCETLTEWGAAEEAADAPWNRHCPLMGRAVRLDTSTGEVRGVYAGIAPNGALRLQVGAAIQQVVSGSGLELDQGSAAATRLGRR